MRCNIRFTDQGWKKKVQLFSNANKWQNLLTAVITSYYRARTSLVCKLSFFSWLQRKLFFPPRTANTNSNFYPWWTMK